MVHAVPKNSALITDENISVFVGTEVMAKNGTKMNALFAPVVNAPGTIKAINPVIHPNKTVKDLNVLQECLVLQEF